MTYPCTQCGLCCRLVSHSARTAQLDRGDGVCIHFVESTDLCGIYDQRPAVCRVDEAYVDYAETMSLVEFYAANAEICNALQKSFGVAGVRKVLVLEK